MRVGFLNLHFLADKTPGELLLIPLADTDMLGLELRAKQRVSAKTVFDTLASNMHTHKEDIGVRTENRQQPH